MPAQQDIEVPIWRGDTILIPFELIDAQDNPISIAGATAVFTLKMDPYASDDAADFRYSHTIAGDDADGLAGRHVIRIERDELAHLELIPHTYQFKLIWPADPEDTEITYVWGKIPVKDS